jgi:hypothetical protein
MIPLPREIADALIGADRPDSVWRKLVPPDRSVFALLFSKEGAVGEIPNDIDRAAIEEHAQRTVERTALRKVRRTLDQIEETEAARRTTLRRVLIACAILAVLGAAVLWGLLFSGSDLPKPAPMKVPLTPPQTQAQTQ